MKQKIKEALQQGYKNLGLGEEVFERVAASVETFIADEADIDKFVKSELVDSLLKFEQAAADRKRAKREDAKKEAAKADETEKKETDTEKKETAQPDIAALLKAALDEKLGPIQARLEAFEAAQAKDAATAALDKFCSEWDYAAEFPKERDEARRIALKVYKAGGEKMSGEELVKAFREEFDPAVRRKGVEDFSKPFKSDGGAADNLQSRFEEIAKRHQASDGAD